MSLFLLLYKTFDLDIIFVELFIFFVVLQIATHYEEVKNKPRLYLLRSM